MNKPRQPPADALILASASPYRRTLLGRLGLPFEVQAADLDERRHAGETPILLANRLASEKAAAIAATHPARLVIGSDQVAVCRGQVTGKPGNHAAAVAQLQAASGQTVAFYTAVALADGSGQILAAHTDLTEVVFRDLDEATIERYLLRETPYDCAGAFKAEALGIALFRQIRSEDPTALLGLPLIWLSAALADAGMQVI